MIDDDLLDCSGSRAVPDDFTEDGYGPCPTCVIEAGENFVVLHDVPETEE